MKNTQVRNIIEKSGPLIAVILLCIFLAISTDTFMTIDNWMNLFRQTAINAMIAGGMLVILLTGGIDLSVGSICALSACIMGVAMKSGVQSSFLLIVICLGVGLLCGLTNGLLYTRLDLPHPFIATLGTMQLFRGLALIITGSAPITGFPGGVTWLGFKNVNGFPICFIAVIIVFAFFTFFLSSTSLGKKIYSVGGNTEAARLSGINVKNVQTFVYANAGLMSGLAALILTGRVGTALPTTGQDYAMDAIASCVIGGTSFSGGKGTVSGTLVGALLVQIVRNGLNLLGQQSDVQQVVIGIVVILAVFIDVRRGALDTKAKRAAQAEAHNASVSAAQK